MNGLRIVLAPGSISPWSEALKQILNVKQLPFVWVAPKMPGPDPELQQWSAQTSVPVAVWNDERPRSSWLEQLYLAERLQPEPALIPAALEDRILMFGYINEIAGENGLAWSQRLMALHKRFTGSERFEHHRFKDWESILEYSRYLGNKYGYNATAAQAAPQRTAEVLGGLDAQLARQRARASRFLIGDRLSALDVYWAAFSLGLSLPPPEWIPTISPAQRKMMERHHPLVERAVTPRIVEHRDFIYRDYLKLPVDF
ncbi:MAG TPA: hypothetical protein VKB84_10855 [Candidatus Binataceae bacterium]|nr:hypothetical protein [Candidatus Binataceae bacterium]